MTKTHHLTSEDRTFFGLVAQAAFSNPFSEQRESLDRQMAGEERLNELRIDLALERVRERITRLEQAKSLHLSRYSEEDRELLKSACLFDAFHRYIDVFDRLILEQIQAGDESCKAAFAGEMLDLLSRWGFPRAEAVRSLAIFYQLRRAFYFIAKSLVGSSAGIRQLRVRLWNNVFTHDTRLYVRYLWNRMEDFSTLLLGETGTGKGAAAGAIGRSGFIPFDEQTDRFTESFCRTFMAINLSQFSATLIESELFGHKKGAFTGALNPHEGLLARCSPHGAIFLDEIGELSVPVQIKLLQVLQERVFSPVGSHEKKRFSGRVIAATNQSIDERRRQGAFRDDFYYRLCSDVLVVPPLRQRIAEEPGELKRLVDHLVRRLAGDDSEELTAYICAELDRHPGRDYSWPGNVRELEQAIRRILLTRVYEGDSRQTGGDEKSRMLERIEAGSVTAAGLLEFYCRQLFQRYGTYEEVARRTGLDRRTAKKYVAGKKQPAE
ncbi:MAG TPA: Fis family transcriptional regulator [Verrucomicrobia bacterium]|nr:MAG: Fis family transcriptional regulator [Lentisphaerae bacterium GWF2_57_35]HBA82563.1 Fis family transcriptional regulator [Verrucomicrobiota bacterium]